MPKQWLRLLPHNTAPTFLLLHRQQATLSNKATFMKSLLQLAPIQRWPLWGRTTGPAGRRAKRQPASLPSTWGRHRKEREGNTTYQFR